MRLVAPSAGAAAPVCGAQQAARRRPVVKAAPRNNAWAQPQQHRRAKLTYAQAAEETTATQTAAESASDVSEDEATPQPEVALTPIEKARQVLDADDVDKAALEGILGELDQELGRLGDSVAAAESRASVLENTVATAKDQLLRLNADFDNFRRRSQNEKEALADSVRGDVVQQLLPLIDNFELARTQVKVETEGEQRINASYQGLYKQMVDIMRGLGIEAVPTAGVPFDPEIHEAIMREPDDSVPDGTVLQEFRKGFRLGEKLLRPAMVKVSMNDGGAPQGE